MADLNKFIKIAVTGPVSAGKSTFLQSLGISQPDKVCTGINRTTFGPNFYIFHEPTNDVNTAIDQAIDHHNWPEQISAMFNDTSEIKVSANNVHLVKNVLGLKNFIIADLPGFDDAKDNENFIKLTLQIMSWADYVLVVSTLTSFSTNSFTQNHGRIHRRAKKNNKNGHFNKVLIVINKIDDPNDVQVYDSVDQIASDYGLVTNSPENRELFRFSAAIHKMYSYKLFSDSEYRDQVIILRDSTAISELNNHLKQAGANNTHAYKLVQAKLAEIISARRNGISLGAEKIELRIKLSHFGGKMLNLASCGSKAQGSGPTSPGDYDDLLGYLTRESVNVPKYRYNASLEHYGRCIGAIIGNMDVYSGCDDKKLMAFDVNSEIKESGDYIECIRPYIMALKHFAPFFVICFRLSGRNIKDKSGENNLFKIFRAKIEEETDEYDKLWTSMETLLAQFMADDLANMGIIANIIKMKEFWDEYRQFCADADSIAEYFRHMMQYDNDFGSGKDNLNMIFSLIEYGRMTAYGVHHLNLINPERVKAVCGFVGLNYEEYSYKFFRFASPNRAELGPLHDNAFDDDYLRNYIVETDILPPESNNLTNLPQNYQRITPPRPKFKVVTAIRECIKQRDDNSAAQEEKE